MILGLNAFHGDSSACIIKGDKIIAAAEEERFRRVKHWAGFPSESIGYCLDSAGLSISDISHIGINSDPSQSFWKKIGYTLSGKASPSLVLEKLRTRGKRKGVVEFLQEYYPNDEIKAELVAVEHHLAHLASCFYVSEFESAAVLSVDGFGDFSSGAWGRGKGNEIDVQNRVYFPHSLGVFYQALTQYIGFPHYGDEYKVMGLAPYGKPKYMEEMRDIARLGSNGEYSLSLKYFRHQRHEIGYEWDNTAPRVSQLYTDALERLLGPARKEDEPLEQKHKDIAHCIQKMYEEAFFNTLNHLHKVTGEDKLCLAGGCAMNSVANGKIYRNTPFKHVYIQPAAGDAGGAVGAALVAAQRAGIDVSGSSMKHAYWGPEFEDSQIREVLGARSSALEEENCEIEYISDGDALARRTAVAISEAKVIGWFQGSMEWGPRALGNRSIVCDPRRGDMKDILNLKIKRRESFRPFAPSILREHVSEWFEEDDDVPFMMKVFQIREDKRAKIPAVTHVDGSGRLQTVCQETNPRYFNLIKEFYKISGVPLLLNTSFNENEPIVCNPDEALDCFLRTNMDVLVLGDYFISRKSQIEKK
ncbi:MAG TPA: carbamoyltransferase [Gammaproteobacteria bacterium]|nr:carbamoyltransferase [Gammaproteobacteria bacterium]